MSRDFIGSKISIITKSQVRYSGTIIGIDAQTSSIVLGNVKSFGTENRASSSTNGPTAGATLPIMQFANSDIEDLKIVDGEQSGATPGTAQQKSSFSMSVVSPPAAPGSSGQSASIHDDPAIVSAVMSSANKESTSNGSIPNRLLHNLQQMTLSEGQSKKEESRINSNSGELAPSWSLLSSSNWEHNNGQGISQQRSGNKSKFFDDFISDKNNASNEHQFNRSQARSSNTHSTQTSRENGGSQYDENGLPIRQPFFADDHSYPPQRQQRQQQPQQQYQQYQPQSNRYQNGNGYQQQQQQQQQRYFHNNRRPPMMNHARRMGGGGNRETFQNNPNDYDADFDFETSNLKFNKLTSDDEPKNPTEFASPKQLDLESSSDYPTLYDKKKSFFDNLVLNEPSDGPAGHKFNRSKNSDTFGSDGYQRNNYRSNGYGNTGGGYRRPNNNYRERNNNNNNNNSNGYRYRY